jgi:hypothetical protein
MSCEEKPPTASGALILAENKTSGTNLGLYAGTDAEFASGSGGLQLSDSGSPGFQFLTIVENFLSKIAAESGPAVAGPILLLEPASITYSLKSKLSEICERCRLYTLR